MEMHFEGKRLAAAQISAVGANRRGSRVLFQSTAGLFVAGILLAMLVVGCSTPIPPGAERGPNGTIAYDVLIEASPPGARIEANGENIGNTPVHLKIFGDPDGTFHDFGSYYYVIRAYPVATNQYVQTDVFQTGHLLTPEDKIPGRIYFDMNQPPPVYVPYPVYQYPYFYEPYGYDPFFSFGFGFHDFGPRFHHGFDRGFRPVPREGFHGGGGGHHR